MLLYQYTLQFPPIINQHIIHGRSFVVFFHHIIFVFYVINLLHNGFCYYPIWT
jgi:hypothetical protein